MEGIVILMRRFMSCIGKKQSGVIININFEKVYHKVNWSFPQQTLRMKGFSTKWCQWIYSFIQGGHVGLKINDQIGPNFKTWKGLRQGDHLSLILFNVGVDMLAVLIKRAKEDGQIAGLILYLVDEGSSILQYVDDTLIFMEHVGTSFCVQKAFQSLNNFSRINFTKLHVLLQNYHKTTYLTRCITKLQI